MPTKSNKGALQLGEIGKDNEGNSEANKGQDDTSKKCKCAPSKHRSDAMYGEESLSSESSEKYCNIRSQPELWPHTGQDNTSKKCKCAPSKHCSDTMDGEESLNSASSGNYGDIRSQPELWPTFDFMRVLHDVYHASDSSSFSGIELPHYLFVRRFTNIFMNQMAVYKAEIIFLQNENENLRLALKLAHEKLCDACVETSVGSDMSEELVTSSPEEATKSEPKKKEVVIKTSPGKSTGSSASETSCHSKKSDSHVSNADSGSTTEWYESDNK
jgi:hypothetical protein